MSQNMVCAPRTALPRALLCALALTGLCLSVPSYAAESAVPDFNGLWHRPTFSFVPPYFSRSGRFDKELIGGLKSPILKPWAAEAILEKMQSESTGHPSPNPNTACWPEGVPAVYSISDMLILQLPDKITILYTDDQAVRYVYLNRAHPKPLEPSWYGHSVGHFEGDTLVVDTAGFHNRPEAMIDHYGTPVSDGLHVVERFSVLKGRSGLKADFTVEDPKVFKKPWSMTIDYEAKDGVIDEYRCGESNRHYFDLMPIAERPDF